MSVERFKADKETIALQQDAQRLRELREVLLQSAGRANRVRVEELTEQLKRIEARLAVLERVP